MKATYTKVKCEVCSQLIDPRGLRSHTMKHQREAASGGKPIVVERVGSKVLTIERATPQDGSRPYATWTEGFRAGYKAGWADAQGEQKAA